MLAFERPVNSASLAREGRFFSIVSAASINFPYGLQFVASAFSICVMAVSSSA